MWQTVRISKVQKKYLYTAVKWCFKNIGPKRWKIKIRYPEFYVSMEYSYPDDGKRNRAANDVFSKISTHDTWTLSNNCSTMIYDVWAKIDSGHVTLNGKGYDIDDWWNIWQIPDGSYRHENTLGIVGYTIR